MFVVSRWFDLLVAAVFCSLSATGGLGLKLSELVPSVAFGVSMFISSVVVS